MGPVVRRSWAQRGCTPVLRLRGRNRINVHMIGALVITPRHRVRAYFSLSPGGSFDGERILAFLKQLCRTVRAPIELVWDRLPAHRGQPVKNWLEQNSHRIRATLLPPYAPELNPVELMWGYAKTNCLANFTPHEIDELIDQTYIATQTIRDDHALLESFLRHCALSFCLR
jgi:putative transposase